MSITIRERIAVALAPVLQNTWAVELPPDPTWPAMVFSIETEEEPGWSMAGGYDRHTINIVVLGRETAEIDAIHAAARAALEAMQPFFVDTDGEGDAEFEEDPDVYGKFLIVQLRTPRF